MLVDARYETLGVIAGYNRYEAIGRMFGLWAWCLDLQNFVVTDDIVVRFLGPNGVNAILANGFSHLALGERRGDSIYVCGTHRLQWLGARRAAGRAGGKKAAAVTMRDESGAFAKPGTVQHVPKPEKAPKVKKAKPRADGLPPVEGWQDIIATYATAYENAHGAKPSLASAGIELKKLRALALEHGAVEVTRRISIAYTSPPAWPAGPWDLKTLIAHFDKLAKPTRNGAVNRPGVGRFEPTEDVDHSKPPWEV